MECVEDVCHSIIEISLDTPAWNIRTNAFYKKLGYTEVKQEEGFVFYKKLLK